MIKLSNTGFILFSLFIAMGLRILPLDEQYSIYNPDWVALIVIFLCIHLPNRFGIGLAWSSGLLTDVLTGRVLGGYALCYSILAYLSLRLHPRLRIFPVYQQAFFVLLFLLISQFVIFWSKSHAFETIHSWRYYLPSLSGTLVWPFISFILNQFRYWPRSHSAHFNSQR